jgi:hypothetical protein
MEFSSRNDVIEWADKERNFWNQYERLRGGSQQSVNLNLRRLPGFREGQSDDEFVSKLQAAGEDYVPSKGPLGLLVQKSSTPQRGANLFAVISNPDFFSSIDHDIFEPYIQATFYNMVDGNLSDILEASRSVREHQAAWADELNDFKKRSTELIQECQRAIENLHTEAAMRAPKSYWGTRAKDHREAVGKARKWWHISLAAMLAIVVACGIILVCVLKPTSEFGAARTIGFGILFTTGLSLLVWLSRQLLRDLRSHEHLAEDASERVTMIETYSALKQAGLETANLDQILAALYRPASTGLIADSGPVLPIEVFLKGVQKTGKPGG